MESENEELESTSSIITSEEQKKIADNLKNIIIDRLKVTIVPDEIKYDTQLFYEGLGLDSIDGLELVAAVDEIYEVILDQDDIDEFRNLKTLSKLILERRSLNI